MAIPSIPCSGQISMGMIADYVGVQRLQVPLGGGATPTEGSLVKKAEIGSPSVNQQVPHKLSEFYCYNRNTGGETHNVNLYFMVRQDYDPYGYQQPYYFYVTSEEPVSETLTITLGINDPGGYGYLDTVTMYAGNTVSTETGAYYSQQIMDGNIHTVTPNPAGNQTFIFL
jgi:hypothetical protein